MTLPTVTALETTGLFVVLGITAVKHAELGTEAGDQFDAVFQSVLVVPVQVQVVAEADPVKEMVATKSPLGAPSESKQNVKLPSAAVDVIVPGIEPLLQYVPITPAPVLLPLKILR